MKSRQIIPPKGKCLIAVLAVAAAALLAVILMTIYKKREIYQYSMAKKNSDLGAVRADYYTFDRDNSERKYHATYFQDDICIDSSTDMQEDLIDRVYQTKYVAIYFSGNLIAPENGNYIFSVTGTSDIFLKVNGQEVLHQKDKAEDMECIADSSIYLKKGEVIPFELQWVRTNASLILSLNWESDTGIEKQPIPKECYTEAGGSELPTVSSIETGHARLDRNHGNTGGKMVVQGTNLEEVDQVLFTPVNAASLRENVEVEKIKTGKDSLAIKVPSDLAAGTYRICLKKKDFMTVSEPYFTILESVSEPKRMEFPRPDWERSEWMSLNGWWDFAFDPEEIGKDEEWYRKKSDAYNLRIQVPFAWESYESGIENDAYSGQAWYRRSFTVDKTWLSEGRRTYICFGAVDAKCTVYVNDQEVGSHDGGYSSFEYDISGFLKNGKNVVAVWVEDKGLYGDDTYAALIGKQGHNAPCGYTSTSGIWQPVYLENRGSTFLRTAQADTSFKPDNSGDIYPENSNSGSGSIGYSISVVSDRDQDVTLDMDFASRLWNSETKEDEPTGSKWKISKQFHLTRGDNQLTLEPEEIKDVLPWSAESPNLYYGTIRLYNDEAEIDTVRTYFGVRSVNVGQYEDREYSYIYVNGKPTFFSGVLDQGFWPEGGYTASDAAEYRQDIEHLKTLGFNMMRKHLKIEDPMEYYWCDRIGIYVFQDMPHATAMNAESDGSDTPGRELFEQTVKDTIQRDCNHPSIVELSLFNETWGIEKPGNVSSDGMTTEEWQKALYQETKDVNQNLMVEDMSVCYHDHIQPTDLNSFHAYPKGYENSKTVFDQYYQGVYVGSQENFREGYRQETEPWLNSEYGGVAAFDGDYDVSWCFKYQTDLLRQYDKLCGFVYTEPYDVEYERNGLFTFDRKQKEFGYSEMAYGGDMSIRDLTQPAYVGISGEPVRQLQPGDLYKSDVIAYNWSGTEYEDPVLCWRLDGTDEFGNILENDAAGKETISFGLYEREIWPIQVSVPGKNGTWTLTVWIESKGKTIAKNYANIITDDQEIQDEVSGNNMHNPNTDTDTDAEEQAEFISTAVIDGVYDESDDKLEYEFDIDVQTLKNAQSVRIVSEISSRKGSRIVDGIPYSVHSQTTDGCEAPVDVEIRLNDVLIDTVSIPDNPRDIRGVLSLLQEENGGSSAGNYGYLIQKTIDRSMIKKVVDAMGEENSVKLAFIARSAEGGVDHDEDSVNNPQKNEEGSGTENGIRVYGRKGGRYLLAPTILLSFLRNSD